MAKRVRGSRSSHRPGGQGPSRTSKTSSSSGSESDASVDIDAAVDAVGAQTSELVIEETATPTTTAVASSKPRRTRRGAKAKADSLQVRSATEGVFVRQDLRRIGIITAVALGALLIAWVVLVQMNALGLY